MSYIKLISIEKINSVRLTCLDQHKINNYLKNTLEVLFSYTLIDTPVTSRPYTKRINAPVKSI